MPDYAHPEVLVSTDWVRDHLSDPKVRLVEVDVDTSAYEQGHIRGAVGWNWQTQLQDGLRRDLPDKAAWDQLLSRSGIARDTTLVFYGDHHNWFAAYAFWQMKYYGHRDVRLMNGGRKKWVEEKRPLVTAVPHYAPTPYQSGEPEEALRARRAEVEAAIEQGGASKLVDVRSPDEFTGKIIAPPGMSETAQRGGHIPGAVNVPWSEAANEDGTFKSAEALGQLYRSKGISGTGPVITYCRIGERSSHTWFALKYLLGLDEVKNYDGSWTEWGNLIGAPIEKGVAAAAG